MISETKDSIPSLNKKQRGRLKKLRKRVEGAKEGCDTSGITSMDDVQELRELDNSLEIGPSIRLRNKSSYGSAHQRADGVDHRSILCQLLQRTNQTKKRMREDLTAPIPAWATLHNPVATTSIVVIEIHWETCPENWGALLAKVPTFTQLLEKKHKKYEILPVETRWFQGPNAQSISDTLMYIPRSQETLKVNKKNKKGRDLKSPLETLPPLLKALAMKPSQLSKEGFPLADKKKIEEDSKSFDLAFMTTGNFSLPKSISPERAAKTIEQCQVPVLPLSGRRHEFDDHPFIQTVPLQGQEPSSIFALDCEMVLSSVGQELARVTLIELQDIDSVSNKISYQVILDELVKPHRPVLDYITEFSGITAKMLDPVSTTLAQVQASLLTILHKEDTLIGHSLENDLLSLHMIHENVVDTSIIFRATNGRKYSLRHVTAVLLGRQIQGSHGHCSEEDALAALELAVRRALDGPSFRIFESSEDRIHMLDLLKHEKEPIVVIGPSKWLNRYVTNFQNGAHALSCDSITDPNRKALSAWLSSSSRRARFAWANFEVSEIEKDINELNGLMTELMERMLPGTLVLVSMQGGHHTALNLTKQRRACQNPKSSLGWSIEQEKAWTDQVDVSRSGIALWIGKRSIDVALLIDSK